MGIRETLNQNPGITTAGTAGIILVALGFIVYQLMGSGSPKIQTESYYTIDDGKTWFADDINKVAPFIHQGKEAVRIFIFSCDGGKTKFVPYLQKYSDEAKKKLEASREGANARPNFPPDFVLQEEIQMTGTLVKRPGDDKWVKQMDPASVDVTEIKCPDGGKMENLEPVLP